jgi:hypothetical protein
MPNGTYLRATRQWRFAAGTCGAFNSGGLPISDLFDYDDEHEHDGSDGNAKEARKNHKNLGLDAFALNMLPPN